MEWRGENKTVGKKKTTKPNERDEFHHSVLHCLVLPCFCYNLADFPSPSTLSRRQSRNSLNTKKKHSEKWKSHKVVNHSSFCMVNLWLFNLLTSHGDHAFWKFKHFSYQRECKIFCFRKRKTLGQCGFCMQSDVVLALIYACFFYFKKIVCTMSD